MSDAEHVPSWVPEIAPGVRADVYPVEPPRPSRIPFCDSPQELVLDRQAVTLGYAERRQPYEFASCLPAAVTSLAAPSLSSAVPGAAPPPFSPSSGSGLSPNDLSKLRTGIAVLRRSRPTKLQRVEQHTFALPSKSSDITDGSAESHTSSGSKKAFPLQKPSGSSTLEDWFNKLSSGANFNTSELSRSVPLGPAIGRATGKVIEMMATRSVPTQRAAWYIRIAVLNECIKQIRPDRPPPSATAFWTRQLCALLKTEMEAIRSRKTAILGSMDRVAFWDYVLDLARWQADEGLLDCKQWLPRIAVFLRSELALSQAFTSPGTKIAVSAARRFLPEFLTSTASSRTLLESLLPGATAIVKAWRGAPTVTSKANAVGGGGQGQGKRDQKSASRKGPLKRTPFTPNLCHREVTMLLSAAVRVLDDSIVGNPESETRMSDLERFVKRGVGIVLKSRNRDGLEAGKIGDKKSHAQGPGTPLGAAKEKNTSPHRAIRELELLPGHGDVSKPTEILRETFETRGGLREAVKEVCSWAVAGPVSDEAEAICVGCAVLLSLAQNFCTTAGGGHRTQILYGVLNQDIHKLRTESSDHSWTPPLQREIWNFLKVFSREKKPSALDSDDRLVRFIAQLCRTEQLSLRVLVRDISRLTSHGHPGTGYLVKCLALLPNPMDQDDLKTSAAASIQGLDCRRPLLRKFGYVANSRPKQGNVSDKVVQAIFSGDMAVMVSETERLTEKSDARVVQSTAEMIRARCSGAWLESSSNIDNVMHIVASFLLLVREPYMAVEWLIGNMNELVDGRGHWKGDTSKRKRQNEILVIMIGLVEDFSRYIAASGLLEVLFIALEKAWISSWVTIDVQKRILLSCAAFFKVFNGSMVDGSSHWTRMIVKHLQKNPDGAPAIRMHALALACLRGKVERNPTGKLDLSDILTQAKREAALGQGQDVLVAMKIDRQGDIDLVEAKLAFSDPERGFPMYSYFAKCFTASDVLGSVFIPVLTDALSESNEGTTDCRFSRLVVSALRLIGDCQNDVRVQGVRPLILVEFISLIIAGCLSGHTEAGVSLEVLVRMEWIWKILAPRAGILLARDLRTRVEYHCNNIGSVDTQVLLALLFNMVTRFLGDSGRDEPIIASSLGKEPFGMIDMQVALLAAYRKECDMEQDFGTRMGEAAVSLICVDSARTLASSVLRSCTDEEWKHVVVGVVGYTAAMGMAESIGVVVGGLIVEAPKNDELSNERAEWYQADAARRGVLECVVQNLSQEVGGQVETVLFDQLVTVSTLLTQAKESESMPSSLPQDGCMMSDALESRLQCILRSQRTPLNRETWAKRTSDLAELLHCAVPLLKQSAISAAANVLALCIRNLVESGRQSEEEATSAGTMSPTLDAVEDEELRKQLTKRLKPILFWLEHADEKSITGLIDARSGYGVRRSDAIRAFTATGVDVDNWLLLEGYGRGTDEEAVVSPVAFGKQGPARECENVTGVVQLKRTYSTFASLAV